VANRFGDLTAVRWPVKGNSESGLSRRNPGQDRPCRDRVCRSIRSASKARRPLHRARTSGPVPGPEHVPDLRGRGPDRTVVRIRCGGRASQIGTLLALGLDRSLVQRVLLWEGGIVAVLGALVGAVLGLVYTRALIAGLSTIWKARLRVSRSCSVSGRLPADRGGGRPGHCPGRNGLDLTTAGETHGHQLLTGTIQDPGTKGLP